jgi:tRNA(Ile)-lysidine synthase
MENKQQILEQTTRKFLKFSDEYDMLPGDGLVLAAVSGGADSMCMLSLLLKASEIKGFQVGAMHFNHSLRGEESDRDEEFVKQFCEEKSILYFSEKGNVAAETKKSGCGTEETARTMRYDFFRRVAKKTGAVRIATAHTADDNAETVLMRLARGTGLKGLQGIPPVRGRIIRPMLRMTRYEVEQYLSAMGVGHVEDSTNFEDIYTRNKIRHKVMPEMKRINPNFCKTISNLTETAMEDEQFLNKFAIDFIEDNIVNDRLDVKKLLSLPKAVSRRVIRQLSEHPLSMEHTESVLLLCMSDDPSSMVCLPGLTVKREYDKVSFCKEIFEGSFTPKELKPGDKIYLDMIDLEISCEELVYNGERQEINNSLNTYLFEKCKICGKLFVRPRETGDRISLYGRNVSKSLKKLFIEKHIPAYIRNLIPVIADENGPVCIYKIGIDKRVAPQKGSNVLKIIFKETN